MLVNRGSCAAAGSSAPRSTSRRSRAPSRSRVLWSSSCSPAGRGQQACSSWSASTGRTGPPTRAAWSTSCSAPSGSTRARPRSTDNGFLGVTWWDWLAGPVASAMTRDHLHGRSSRRAARSCCSSSPPCRTSRSEVEEAAMVDGATGVAAVPAGHAAAAAADALHGADARPDRRRGRCSTRSSSAPRAHPARPRVTPAYLSYTTGVPEPELGPGGRDRLHPVRDHRAFTAPAAVGAARARASSHAPRAVPPADGAYADRLSQRRSAAEGAAR